MKLPYMQNLTWQLSFAETPLAYRSLISIKEIFGYSSCSDNKSKDL